jgi:hypothetical protein
VSIRFCIQAYHYCHAARRDEAIDEPHQIGKQGRQIRKARELLSAVVLDNPDECWHRTQGGAEASEICCRRLRSQLKDWKYRYLLILQLSATTCAAYLTDNDVGGKVPNVIGVQGCNEKVMCHVGSMTKREKEHRKHDQEGEGTGLLYHEQHLHRKSSVKELSDSRHAMKDLVVCVRCRGHITTNNE